MLFLCVETLSNNILFLNYQSVNYPVNLVVTGTFSMILFLFKNCFVYLILSIFLYALLIVAISSLLWKCVSLNSPRYPVPKCPCAVTSASQFRSLREISFELIRYK